MASSLFKKEGSLEEQTSNTVKKNVQSTLGYILVVEWSIRNNKAKNRKTRYNTYRYMKYTDMVTIENQAILEELNQQKTENVYVIKHTKKGKKKAQ